MLARIVRTEKGNVISTWASSSLTGRIAQADCGKARQQSDPDDDSRCDDRSQEERLQRVAAREVPSGDAETDNQTQRSAEGRGGQPKPRAGNQWR